jgi:hypothetical protein
MSSLVKLELEREFAQLERKNSDPGSRRNKSDALPTNRHGVRKQQKRLKADKSRPKFGGAAATKKKIKFSFLELQSKDRAAAEERERVDEGVKKLLQVSTLCHETDAAESYG